MAYLSSASTFIHDSVSAVDSNTKKRIITISAAVVGVITLKKCCAYACNYFGERHLRERKLNQVQITKGKLLQKLVGLKQPIENRDVLTKLSYEELQGRIQRDDLKVVDLIEAYQAKALEVDRRLNCLSDIIYDADVAAIYLDSIPHENRGHLHGIPLSVKETFSQKGYDSNMGYISRCLKLEKNTASVVEALTNEGMVPFARTMMSQGGLSSNGDNSVFGETLNPHDPKRISGGSSSGEGALIGARGSVVGLGGDVAGSIRIPSSYCGIYGFKPTADRTGKKNMAKSKFQSAPATYTSTYGPMSSDFNLLVDVLKVLYSEALFELNKSIPPLPFDNETFEDTTPLKIGMYTSFSDKTFCLETVPAVKRAIELAKTALESRGHTVIDWEPPRIGYACDLLLRCMFPDGGRDLTGVANEGYTLTRWTKILSDSAWLSQLQVPFLKKIYCGFLWLKSPLASNFLSSVMNLRTSGEVIDLIREANAYKNEFANAWEEAGLDGVICPVLPVTAPLVEDSNSAIFGDLHCNLYNFMNYPAGSVPVTLVTAEDDNKLLSTYGCDRDHRRMIKTQSGSAGMPVGVQCVAERWRDEKCLRIMKEVMLGLVKTP